jgi:radical SAM protein with 4Fe4S-binding SPASM domain
VSAQGITMKKSNKPFICARPKLSGTLLIEPKKDNFLVYIKEYPVWSVVNWVGVILLQLCNGKNTISSIIDILSQFNKSSREKNEREIIKSLQYFADICMIKLPDGTTYNNLSPKLYQPFVIYLNITNKCNLTCPYCYANAGQNDKNELTTEEIFKVLNSARNLSENVKINVSGGEPLLRPDIWDIAKECKRLAFSVTLLTNGTLVTKQVAKKIKEHFDSVLLSIDSPIEKVHDRLRGKGSFKKAIAALKHLSKTKIPLKLGTTITTQNISSIPDILKIRQIKPSMLSLNLLVGAGRGKRNAYLRPTNDEVLNLFKKLEKADKAGKDVPGFRDLQPAKLTNGGNCRAGRNIFLVASNGDVYPCHALERPELRAGNVRKQDIMDIFKNSKIFRQYRSFDIDKVAKCKNCDIKLFCGGGCRADAYISNGKLHSSTTYCSFLHDAYKEYMALGAPRRPVLIETKPN